VLWRPCATIPVCTLPLSLAASMGWLMVSAHARCRKPLQHRHISRQYRGQTLLVGPPRWYPYGAEGGVPGSKATPGAIVAGAVPIPFVPGVLQEGAP